jgi:hypothetical protein
MKTAGRVFLSLAMAAGLVSVGLMWYTLWRLCKMPACLFVSTRYCQQRTSEKLVSGYYCGGTVCRDRRSGVFDFWG